MEEHRVLSPDAKGSNPFVPTVAVAQLVVQRIVIPPVTGSSPACHPLTPIYALLLCFRSSEDKSAALRTLRPRVQIPPEVLFRRRRRITRRSSKAVMAGSIPSRNTLCEQRMFPSEIFPHRPVDQDTPLLKAKPGFESLCGNHDRMAEWSMAAVCNTVFRGFESRSCLHK